METKRYINRMGNHAIILSRHVEKYGCCKTIKTVKCRIVHGVTFEPGFEFVSSEEQFNKDWREL